MRAPAPGLDLPIGFDRVTIADRAVTLLDSVTLEIEEGPPTVLIGPNGAGKTTFLRAAMGLLAPSRGRITWGGHDTSPPVHRAFMFQTPAMLKRSAAGNLAYALRTAGYTGGRGKDRIAELLDLVGLSGLGNRAAPLMSLGERKRLALARALARDPAILFLDEPTANLDPAAVKAIEDVIRVTAARGVKVIMSTHDLGEARRLARDVILLHRGRVVERGEANAFFTAPRTAEARSFIAGDLLL